MQLDIKTGDKMYTLTPRGKIKQKHNKDHFVSIRMMFWKNRPQLVWGT